jgi:hypothetical protein
MRAAAVKPDRPQKHKGEPEKNPLSLRISSYFHLPVTARKYGTIASRMTHWVKKSGHRRRDARFLSAALAGLASAAGGRPAWPHIFMFFFIFILPPMLEAPAGP